jgi:fatty acid desaturase
MTREQEMKRLVALKNAICEKFVYAVDQAEKERLKKKLQQVDDILYTLSTTSTVWVSSAEQQQGTFSRKEVVAIVGLFILLTALVSLGLSFVLPTAPLFVVVFAALLIVSSPPVTLLGISLTIQEVQEREFYRELTEAEAAKRKAVKMVKKKG